MVDEERVVGDGGAGRLPLVLKHRYGQGRLLLHHPSLRFNVEWYIMTFKNQRMGGLDAETRGTKTFLVSVLVSIPVRPKKTGLEKVSVSRDFIKKFWSQSRFHEPQN